MEGNTRSDRDCKVSVIIPVRNAEQHLSTCLRAVAQQVGVAFEVILVNDGASLESNDAVKTFGYKVLNTLGGEGAYIARNLGAREACGEYLLFIDADVCVPPGIFLRATEHLEGRPELSAVFGAYDDSPATETLLSQYRNLLHAYFHQRASKEASTFWAGFGLIRRDVFERFGGFAVDRENLRDIDLGIRLTRAGHLVELERELRVRHLKTWTLRNMLRTDIFLRAANWTELILRHRHLPDNLNIRNSERFAVALALFSGILLAVATLERSWVAATALLLAGLLYMWVTRDILQHLARVRNVGFAVRAFPIHVLYHYCCATGLAIGVCRYYGLRQRLIKAGISGALCVMFLDVVSGLEHWPFSNFAMYSGKASRELSWLRLYGVSGTREMALDEPSYLAPFDEVHLNAALERVLAQHPASVNKVLEHQLEMYESDRLSGKHSGPRLSQMRLYRVVWDLRDASNTPASRTLIAATERGGF